MEWVKLFINKAKMHFYEDLDSESTFASNTRSSALSPPPLAVAILPRKSDTTKNVDDLLSSFYIRKEQPKELHHCIWKHQNFKGVCVVHYTLYKQKKKSGNDVDYKKFMKCTKAICNYCLLQNEKWKEIYLCPEHFGEFHNH
eukprot:8948686-Ditylum_brightwellii.AAC.1